VNEEYSPSVGASAPSVCLSQAIVWRCGRISARFYLALHPAGSLPVGSAVPVGCCCTAELRVYGRWSGTCPLTYREEGTILVNGADMCPVVFVCLVPVAVYAPLPRSPIPLLTPRGLFYCCFNQSVKTAPGFLAPPSPVISAAFSSNRCGLNRLQAIL
jgi:hypothetical protein